MAWLLVLPAFVSAVDDTLARAINQMVGHSRIFDTIATLPLQNDLVKAGVIGACFFAVWFGKRSPEETQRVRKILLATLIGATMAIATTRSISDSVFLPRPFIRSQKLYHLEHDRLVQVSRFGYRVPLDKASQLHYQELRSGHLWSADLGSFPSDHAGLFISVSLGLCLASAPIGGLALAWTVIVILGSKLLGGQHTPFDVLAGATIAVIMVSISQFLARRWLGSVLDRVAVWTMEHRALSSALLFVAVFEICSTLYHLTSLMHGAASLVKSMVP